MSEGTQDRAAKTEEQGTATDQFGAVSEKKVAKPAPVACEQSVERPPLDAASVDLD